MTVMNLVLMPGHDLLITKSLRTDGTEMGLDLVTVEMLQEFMDGAENLLTRTVRDGLPRTSIDHYHRSRFSSLRRRSLPSQSWDEVAELTSLSILMTFDMELPWTRSSEYGKATRLRTRKSEAMDSLLMLSQFFIRGTLEVTIRDITMTWGSLCCVRVKIRESSRFGRWRG